MLCYPFLNKVLRPASSQSLPMKHPMFLIGVRSQLITRQPNVSVIVRTFSQCIQSCGYPNERRTSLLNDDGQLLIYPLLCPPGCNAHLYWG